MRYVAFDVETPNRYNNRMSAIGIAVVEDGRIADTFFSLVDPEQPFDWFNTQLTGIDSEAVLGAPTFDVLWPRIEPILSSGVLVAHNAPFDLRMLRQECAKFDLCFGCNGIDTCDTLALSRRLRPDLPDHKLATLVERLPVDGVNSHDSLDDALACAGAFFKLLGTQP